MARFKDDVLIVAAAPKAKKDDAFRQNDLQQRVFESRSKTMTSAAQAAYSRDADQYKTYIKNRDLSGAIESIKGTVSPESVKKEVIILETAQILAESKRVKDHHTAEMCRKQLESMMRPKEYAELIKELGQVIHAYNTEVLKMSAENSAKDIATFFLKISLQRSPCPPLSQ